MRKTQHPERVACAVPVAIRNKKTSWKVVFYGGVDIHYVLIKFRISWWVVQKKGVPPCRGHCIFLAKDKGSWVVFLFVFFFCLFLFYFVFCKGWLPALVANAPYATDIEQYVIHTCLSQGRDAGPGLDLATP